ncbi:MAG: hypothetical protein M1823_001203 [Watsoniomyces obsoletus]|nr:MAG: hypothetical protein M1823_001203 [Watsoniomyces obsoletus]
MTTHVPSSAGRKPFGLLDESRLQSLQSTKNRQNAIPMGLSSPSHKRRLPFSTLDHDNDDSENVDPTMSTPKRLKNLNGLESKSSPWTAGPIKRSNFSLIDATPEDIMDTKPVSAPISTRAIAKPKSRLNRATKLGLTTTPTPVSTSTKTMTPSKIHAAGRSPTTKRAGILNKRRTASPFVRIDPPTKSRRTGSLSIDAALGGTIRGSASKSRAAPTISRPAPSLDEQPTKGTWFFEIHEDTPDEILTTIMQHGTGRLDISDDEDGSRAKNDRGKENIPPEAPIESVAQSIAGAIENTAEPETTPTPVPTMKQRVREMKRSIVEGATRAPLANLAVSDFYEEAMLSSATFDFTAETTKEDEAVFDTTEPIEELVPVTTEEERLSPSRELRGSNTAVRTEATEIQIWESASAASDAE